MAIEGIFGFAGILASLKKKYPINKEKRIVLLGPETSGKTLLLYKLKLDEVLVDTIPTIGFNVETISYKGRKFTTWDVGGSEKIIPLWRHYLQYTDGIIFMINGGVGDKREYFFDVFRRMIESFR